MTSASVKEKPLKAYAVTEENENTGSIFFARHSITAAKAGANEHNGGDLHGISCRRAPWADEWATKDEDIPARVMIDHGWHFECHGCGSTIDEDFLDENDLPLGGVIGNQYGPVFCCHICECEHKLERAVAKDHERRAILWLESVVHQRFPGVKFVDDRGRFDRHAYACRQNGEWVVQQGVVSFEFPGMKIGPATCRFDNVRSFGPVKPQYSCCFGDKEAFESYVEETRPSLSRNSIQTPEVKG